MNKKLLSLIAGAVVIGSGTIGIAAEDYPKTNINVVGNLGITTQYRELEQPFWTTRIPEASGGAVTAEIKPWNEMGMKGPEVIRLLNQGLFDIGTTQLGFLAGDAPINDSTDLAGLSPNIEQFKQVTDAFRSSLARYYEETLGVHLLGLWSFQAQVLYCRDELTGLKDLKGRKIRGSGLSQSDFLEYFGASGIPMAFGEVQQALQNGVIDCAITGTLGGYKAKWHESAKYLYPLAINWGSAVQAANMSFWNKLDPKVQKLIEENVAELEKDIFEQNRRENELGINCNTGAGECTEGEPAKMILVPVSEEDLKLREKALIENVLPRWAERCGADCVDKWNESVGPIVGLKAPVK